jgi:DNA-binding NtrC family response regulator
MSDGAGILLVDDDDAMRDACAEVLQKEGYAVTVSSSGTEAVSILGERSFEIVVLDVKMPGPSGMDILAWLRQESADISVIIITGFATVDLAVEAMKTLYQKTYSITEKSIDDK